MFRCGIQVLNNFFGFFAHLLRNHTRKKENYISYIAPHSYRLGQGQSHRGDWLRSLLLRVYDYIVRSRSVSPGRLPT